MQLQTIGPMTPGCEPLVAVSLPKPEPTGSQVLLRVLACGVCHTELDEIEGRTPPPRLPIIPGHEVVGSVVGLGPEAKRFQMGDRVGVGWVHQGSGGLDENLRPDFVATGRDINGGYAQYMTVSEEYAYPIPDAFSDTQAAPLLCAGAVGYRALLHCELEDCSRLGLMGFGASGHLTLQLVRHLYPNAWISVFDRDAQTRDFACNQGADWVGSVEQPPHEPLDAIIDTTPAWWPVLQSLAALRPGGRLVINAIRKEDTDKHRLLELDYSRHLWLEKQVMTIANVTHHELSAYLPLAEQAGIRPTVTELPLDHANQALNKLKAGGNMGAMVLVPS